MLDRLDGGSKGGYRCGRSLNVDLAMAARGRPGMEGAGRGRRTKL